MFDPSIVIYPRILFKAVLHGSTCNNDFLRNTVSWKVDPRVTCHRERFSAQHWVRQHVASFWISFKNTIRCCHENTIRCCAENRCCELTRVTPPLHCTVVDKPWHNAFKENNLHSLLLIFKRAASRQNCWIALLLQRPVFMLHPSKGFYNKISWLTIRSLALQPYLDSMHTNILLLVPPGTHIIMVHNGTNCYKVQLNRRVSKPSEPFSYRKFTLFFWTVSVYRNFSF